MICKWCKLAGDNNSRLIGVVDTKLAKDLLGKVKTLHSKCGDAGCFCQHRVGKTTHK